MGRTKQPDVAVLAQKYSTYLEWILVVMSALTALYWLTGQGLFHSEDSPVMSVFTSVSIFVMAGCRLAEKYLVGWSKPMTLALVGMVAGGNASSILMLLLVPELILVSFPSLVPTSILTSFGLICFCLYEIFILLRKSPRSGLIIDDILLHLALMPGMLSLLGQVLGVPAYMGITVDPRSGVGLLEMAFMGTFATYAVASNPNLFMWDFLARKAANRLIFGLLFVNQYVAPMLVGLAAARGAEFYGQPGIEFFVLLAGFVTTLGFLIVNAFRPVKN
jgi:hypothetical protein